MRIGLQLWSLNEECKNDFIGTLKKVSEIGYNGVEFAGYGGLSSLELKKNLDKLHLKPCGSHVPLDDLENNLQEVIKYNLEIENKYIICPYATFDKENDIERIANILNCAARECEKYGLIVGYHNHNHEFEKIDNEFILDNLFSKLDKSVISELDTYWTEYAGVKSSDYINKNKERTKLIHIKDMIIINGEKSSTEVGSGILDIESFIKRAKENNLEWIIVEQESFHKSPIKSVKEGLEYLNTLI